MRFLLVGFDDNKGYAIKDLDDGMVEYFDMDSVIDLSKKVKIYGVENGNIDLNWFDSYYSRCVLAYGEEVASRKLGIIRYNGMYSLCKTYSVSYSYNFLEFIECRDCCGFLSGVVNDFLFPDGVCEYLCKHNSTFFHMKEKYTTWFIYDIDLLNKLDIQRGVANGCIINFNDLESLIVVDDLKMHNCTYKLKYISRLYLDKIPNSTLLDINLNTTDIVIYVAKSFNLNCLSSSGDFAPTVYVEDGVDLNLLAKRLNLPVRRLRNRLKIVDSKSELDSIAGISSVKSGYVHIVS